MLDFIASGRVVDLALALLGVEALALALYARRGDRYAAVRDLIPSLLAGTCLLLALRTALTDGSPVWIALALAAALPAHLLDLYQRRRRDVG